MTQRGRRLDSVTDAAAIEAAIHNWVEESNLERTFAGKIGPAVRWAQREEREPVSERRLTVARKILRLTHRVRASIGNGEAETAAVDALELAWTVAEARVEIDASDAARAASRAANEERKHRAEDVSERRLSALQKYMADPNNSQEPRIVARQIAKAPLKWGAKRTETGVEKGWSAKSLLREARRIGPKPSR